MIFAVKSMCTALKIQASFSMDDKLARVHNAEAACRTSRQLVELVRIVSDDQRAALKELRNLSVSIYHNARAFMFQNTDSYLNTKNLEATENLLREVSLLAAAVEVFSFQPEGVLSYHPDDGFFSVDPSDTDLEETDYHYNALDLYNKAYVNGVYVECLTGLAYMPKSLATDLAIELCSDALWLGQIPQTLTIEDIEDRLKKKAQVWINDGEMTPDGEPSARDYAVCACMIRDYLEKFAQNIQAVTGYSYALPF